MRKVIALDESTGSTNMQDDEPCSYHRLLGVVRSEYERQDVAAPKPAPMAQVSWADAMTTADRLKQISDVALTLELHGRGYEVAGKILSGKYYSSGKKVHKKKSKRGTQ